MSNELLRQGLDFSYRILANPLQVNPMEGRDATRAWLMVQRLPLYSSFSDYPFLCTIYGPIFYIAAAGADMLLGPGLLGPRLVSLVSLAVTAFFVGAITRRETGSVWAGLVAAILIVTSPNMEYGAFSRPDMIAWAFLFSATWLAVNHAHGPDRTGRASYLAAALTTCSFFAKQMTWPFIAVVWFYLLCKRRFAFLARYAGATIVSGTIVFLVLHLVTHGMYLVDTVQFPKLMAGLADLNKNEFAEARLLTFWNYNKYFIVVYFLGLLYRAVRHRLFLNDMMFIAFAPFLLIILRWHGAEYNHFVPMIFVMSIGVGELVAELARSGMAGKAAGLAVLALVLPIRFDAVTSFDSLTASLAQNVRAHARLTERLDATTGPILSDAESSYLALNREAFNRMKLYDGFESGITDRVGIWDLARSKVASDIRARGFPTILASEAFQSPTMLSLLSTYYRKDEVIRHYALYKPRPDAAILVALTPDTLAAEDRGMGLSVRSIDNLKVDSNNHLAPATDGGAGEVTLVIESPSPMDHVRLRLNPRFNAASAENWLTMETSSDGQLFAKAATIAPPAGGSWTPIWGMVVSPKCDAQGAHRLFVRLSLHGETQLWIDAVHPLIVYVDTVPRGLT
jgi:hypothetical protein